MINVIDNNCSAVEEEQHNTEWIEGLAILLAVVSIYLPIMVIMVIIMITIMVFMVNIIIIIVVIMVNTTQSGSRGLPSCSQWSLLTGQRLRQRLRQRL